MDFEDFEFREIKQEEADEAARMEQVCFPPEEACTPDRMRERVRLIPGLFLVAYDKNNKKIAGFIDAVASDEEDLTDDSFTDSECFKEEGKNLFLTGVEVLPEYRGRRLAHELMRRYLAKAEADGRQRVVLTCLAEKVGFYQTMGYRDQGISSSEWGGKLWNQMTYDLDLHSGWNLACGARAVLKKGGGRAFKSGGLWIYDNEIAGTDGSFQDGDILEVDDYDGYMLGYGFVNSRSTISIRMLTRGQEEQVTPDLLYKRVQAAWDYRTKVIDTSSCRVIFGEADFLPGLTVDKYEDVLVVESLALGIERLKPLILRDLKDVLAKDQEHGTVIRGTYERSDAKVREKEGMERKKGFLSAPFDTKVRIVENGVKYIVDVENGQKTGFFLDQKDNRAAIRRLCGNAEVIDLFTHTGSFALNAAAAGARHVTAVDASELAIEQAEENAKLNGFDDRMDFICRDIFELLPELEKAGKKYDVVILDPPAFTKSRNSVKAAAKGYREINIRGMKLVKKGGFLATCSCSHFMTPELFTKAIREAAHDAHVRLRQIEFRTQAPDHPILWNSDETYYLKFYLFQVI